MARSVGVVIMVLALTGLANAELLTNPNFEDNGGSFDGWEKWSGGSGSGTGGYWSLGDTAVVNVVQDGTAHSGTTHIEHSIANSNDASSWGWGVSLIHQTVPVVTGETYTFSAWVRDQNPAGPAEAVPALLSLEQRWDDGSWIPGTNRPPEVDLDGDGSNDRINQQFDIPTDGQWHYISFVHTIPVGVNAVTAVGSTSTWNNTIAFDDVSLVPEPMTLALMGLGGLFLRRRR